ncbi:response regulator [Pleionea sp. CnH1-48]|uniref:response regulator n=1 Tax=Pleionea sp. CnH1-48 TaxID=2954494 RepID=UPI002097E906|nr:response regulator [Pleionea sp. CnH1-48]MCO7223468.1 response regulator [Pleionea sp. CnH1-48]
MSKILIVDDSKMERENLYQIVSDAGYQVSLASSGKEALERVSKEPPSLIFLDVIMDDLDGFKVCRSLKSDKKTKDIPIVFVTSKGEKADKKWGEMLGARDYITKPFNEDDIVRSLGKSLR